MISSLVLDCIVNIRHRRADILLARAPEHQLARHAVHWLLAGGLVALDGSPGYALLLVNIQEVLNAVESLIQRPAIRHSYYIIEHAKILQDKEDQVGVPSDDIVLSESSSQEGDPFAEKFSRKTPALGLLILLHSRVLLRPVHPISIHI